MRFQSTGPLRDPTPSPCQGSAADIFQSTGPLRDPTLRRVGFRPPFPDFNPQVPCGTRLLSAIIMSIIIKFQSTGPLRDPTVSHFRQSCTASFQSTGPLRDPTNRNDHPAASLRISIHRSLAGPDIAESGIVHWRVNFNPQVPCGTRQILLRKRQKKKLRFQSTGPLRDPTTSISHRSTSIPISIHRSLAGPDISVRGFQGRYGNFNPQVPCGTRPLYRRSPSGAAHFNPQVPCGTRLTGAASIRISGYFNPQVPCGTRQTRSSQSLQCTGFQSTGPLRDPTGALDRHKRHIEISIHRSLAGPDGGKRMSKQDIVRFQSTGPLRDPTRMPALTMR